MSTPNNGTSVASANRLSLFHNSISTPTMKADTGASKHFTRTQDLHLLKKLERIKQGPAAILPDNTIIKPSHTGYLNLSPELSSTATKSLVYPAITNESLLSIGQLCDNDCIALFNKSSLHIFKDDKIIIKGTRNTKDGLWDVPFHTKQNLPSSTPTSKTSINYIIQRDQSKTDLGKYLHGCAFSPVISTFQKAIKSDNFITWPGIDTINFSKAVGMTPATAKGHLDQERKNLQSTKQIPEKIDKDEDTSPQKIPSKTYTCLTTIIPAPEKNMTYSDQTGRFPYQSSRGTQYIYIVYDYDANAILHAPLKSRKADDITSAWKKCHKRLINNGHEVHLHILDNEVSATMKHAFETNGIKFQLVPPHQHRRNAAERAIRTFKNHLLAGLATCDPTFPIREWDRILQQCELTLNLLRNSRVNPQLSAWAYLFGNYNFNKIPLAPPGTKVLVHSKPGDRKTWSYHGEEGFYVGPATDHYRCIRCYMPKSHSERITDTVTFIPSTIPIPTPSLTDHVHATSEKLIHLLSHKSLPFGPSLKTTTKENILKLAEILHQDKTPPIKLPALSTPPLVIPTSEGAPTNTSSSTTTSSPVIPTSEGAPTSATNKPTKIPTTSFPTSEGDQNDQSALYKSTSEGATPPQIDKPNTSTTAPSNTQEKLHSSYNTNKSPSLTPPPTSYPKSPFKMQTHPMLLRRRHKYNFGTNFKHKAAKYILAQHLELKHQVSHIYSDTGRKMSVDALLAKDPDVWAPSVSNEIGRLAQGIRNVAGNDAMVFIHKHEVPHNKKVTYANMVCDVRPKKDDVYRTRLTVGGDKLDYDGDASSPAASLIETKLLINSVISVAKNGARFFTFDIKDQFLQSMLPEPEYMRIHSRYFFQDIRQKYNIDALIAPDGYVYCKITKGMYGLKQAARLANDKLVDLLAPFGYAPDPYAPNIWSHNSRRTVFCLCVDDFGVQYYNQDDVDHLVNALKTAFQVYIDYDGKDYCGLKLEWNYEKGYVDVDMHGFVTKTRVKLQHPPPRKPQHAPHRWNPPVYGKKQQMITDPDTSPLLSPKDKQVIESIVGSFLYYGRAVDSTILPTLNEIGMQQSKPTVKTQEEATMLLDYLYTHPNAKIRFYASDMRLHIDTDAAYLIAPGAKSRFAGHYYMGSNTSPSAPQSTHHNAPIHVNCKLLKHVVSSAAEAETGGLFSNCQAAIPIRHMLAALHHPQPPTPVRTDNSTASAFANQTLKAKRSKSWDMRYHWLTDRVNQRQFIIYWDKGSRNWADYFTKHFPPSYHQAIRQHYILKGYHIIII